MSFRSFLLPGLLVIAGCLPAAASSSAWQESEGGAVRLVTTGEPDAEGVLKGALEIRLKPGWKTYWRDPGQTGVPPSVDATRSPGVKGAELLFPPPVRIDDGYAGSAGYDEPVTLPVVFTLAERGAATPIEADVFLGLCKTICIPMQAALTVDPAAEPADAGDTATVEAALAALPAPPSEGFRVTGARLTGDAIEVRAEIPEAAASAALFVASAAGYLFGLPTEKARDGRSLTFSAEVFETPEAPASPPPTFDYTLIAGDRAVAGKLRLR